MQCAAYQLPSEFGPPPNSRALLPSADENILYEEVDGLGMRVSSGLGTTRSEAERLWLDQGETEYAQHKTQGFMRVPSDRHTRLAENLASQAERVEEFEGEGGESPTSPPNAEPPLDPPSHPNTEEAAHEAAALRKMGDKAARDGPMAAKGVEPASADANSKVDTYAKVERLSTAGREAKAENKSALTTTKRPTGALVPSRPFGPAVSSATTKRIAGVSPSKAGGSQGSGHRITSGSVHVSGASSLSTNHRDRAPQKTRETRHAPSRPVTKESSQDRIKTEASRTSTARSHVSLSSR